MNKFLVTYTVAEAPKHKVVKAANRDQAKTKVPTNARNVKALKVKDGFTN